MACLFDNLVSQAIGRAGGAVQSSAYDGEGRRVKKVNESRTVVYVYGVGGNLIQEYDTATPTETGRQYVAQDMLGSTRVVFNSTGTAVRCMDDLPFGEQIPQGVGSGRSGACWAASEEPRQKFTGKEREGADGAYLDFCEARYFSAAQGRFTTPDWAEKPEPVPYAEFEDTQSLNLYGYVRNNPINNRDLDGHVCWPWSPCAKVPPPLKPHLHHPPPPPFLRPNPTFPTIDAAGKAAARLANIPTQKEKVEYGTRVFRIAGGQYSYSDLVTQKGWRSVDVDDGQRTPRIPPGTTLAGDAHAHPLNPLLEYDRFSGGNGDIGRANQQRIPSYLATPSGSILVYDPTRTPTRYAYLEYRK